MSGSTSVFPVHGSALRIGSHELPNRVFVAPMAGVTDRPFRQLCKQLGAGYAVSEMAASNALLWATDKTTRRINHDGEITPRAVQIAGADPAMMALAARFNVDRGAQIIDINMGCPAKKVCNVAAGSALMQQPELIREIVQAVIAAVKDDGIPVTLKMRTGWNAQRRNAPEIARMIEDLGVTMVTVHGRTREDKYRGNAEYDTIALIKQQLRIPVVANGDIDSPQKAKAVIDYTGADAVTKQVVARKVLHRAPAGLDPVPQATSPAELWSLRPGHRCARRALLAFEVILLAEPTDVREHVID